MTKRDSVSKIFCPSCEDFQPVDLQCPVCGDPRTEYHPVPIVIEPGESLEERESKSIRLTDAGAKVITLLSDGDAWTTRRIGRALDHLTHSGKPTSTIRSILLTLERAERVNCLRDDPPPYHYTITRTGRADLQAREGG